ncbi:hypothetical protein Dimus_036706 [Dionaea muscipula]
MRRQQRTSQRTRGDAASPCVVRLHPMQMYDQRDEFPSTVSDCSELQIQAAGSDLAICVAGSDQESDEQLKADTDRGNRHSSGQSSPSLTPPRVRRVSVSPRPPASRRLTTEWGFKPCFRCAPPSPRVARAECQQRRSTSPDLAEYSSSEETDLTEATVTSSEEEGGQLPHSREPDLSPIQEIDDTSPISLSSSSTGEALRRPLNRVAGGSVAAMAQIQCPASVSSSPDFLLPSVSHDSGLDCSFSEEINGAMPGLLAGISAMDGVRQIFVVDENRQTTVVDKNCDDDVFAPVLGSDDDRGSGVGLGLSLVSAVNQIESGMDGVVMAESVLSIASSPARSQVGPQFSSATLDFTDARSGGTMEKAADLLAVGVEAGEPILAALVADIALVAPPVLVGRVGDGMVSEEGRVSPVAREALRPRLLEGLRSPPRHWWTP